MIVDLNQLVRLKGEFRQSGTLFDPTSVKCAIRRPGGKVVEYVYGTDAALVKESTGLYYVNQLMHLSGVWGYRFYSPTSGQESADEQIVRVKAGRAIITPRN